MIGASGIFHQVNDGLGSIFELVPAANALEVGADRLSARILGLRQHPHLRQRAAGFGLGLTPGLGFGVRAFGSRPQFVRAVASLAAACLCARLNGQRARRRIAALAVLPWMLVGRGAARHAGFVGAAHHGAVGIGRAGGSARAAGGGWLNGVAGNIGAGVVASIIE